MSTLSFRRRPLAVRSDLARLTAAITEPVAIAFDRAPWARRAPPARLLDWAERFRDNLENGILRFWLEHAVDHGCGGVFGWLDRRGRPIAPGTKPMVPQMRVIWLFAAAYRRSAQPAYRDLAAHVLDFVQAKLWDRRHGGFFWIVDREGRLIDDRKHIFGQSYALFGLAEYARAFGDAEVGARALELFDLLERHVHDEINGAYRTAASSSDWLEPLAGDRFFGAAGGKHQCGVIALLEGLLSLYDATGEARVRSRIEEIVELALVRMIDLEKGYTRVHFSDDWQSLAPHECSYGHDIKLSWLLVRAAAVLGRADDPRVRRAALALAEHTLRYGFDHRRGGVYWKGAPQMAASHRRKVWWPQAEALIGFLNAYEISGEPRYRAAFERQARYVWSHCIDHRHGDWLQSGGTLGLGVTIKANPWKEPYHQGRACLEVASRLEALPDA
jgi:cellobiose epimerase